MAIQQYISIIGGVYLTAFVFNILAPNFGAQKNFPKAFQLVAYCYTAICIGGIFYIHWKLSFLAGLTGLYGLYILYLGIRPMMKIPEEKAGSYYIVILLCMIGISISLSIILGSIFGIRTLIF